MYTYTRICICICICICTCICICIYSEVYGVADIRTVGKTLAVMRNCLWGLSVNPSRAFPSPLRSSPPPTRNRCTILAQGQNGQRPVLLLLPPTARSRGGGLGGTTAETKDARYTATEMKTAGAPLPRQRLQGAQLPR